MKFVFAPDSFKGTLSSQEIIDILTEKAQQYFKDVQTQGVLIADGGEGTIVAVERMKGGSRRYLEVTGPLGEKVNAHYLRLNEKQVLIEMATASGITLIPYREGNALYTTSYGTGEMIKDALASGADDIIISIGGSATNDGGMGMLMALGVRFLDKDGKELEPVGKNLLNIAKIDTASLNRRVKTANSTVMCDVTNPLIGPNGATYVFGPQKGANAKQLKLLESGMKNYAAKIKETLGADVANLPGGGAAGGMGAALTAFCGASLQSGIKTILDLINFENIIADADLIITGEGRIDGQSAGGKVLDGIGRYAKKRNIPVIALTGGMGDNAHLVYDCGIDSIMVTVNAPMSLDTALTHAEPLLADCADRLFRFIKIGMNLR